jgi:hypothetical protein
MRLGVIWCLLTITSAASACDCLVSRSACGEVGSSNLVFIGTVEAIRPTILNPWGDPKPQQWINDPEIKTLKKSQSPSDLNRLKDRYLKLFFDLPQEESTRVQTAASQRELQQVIDSIVAQGTQVQFKVKKLIRRAKDDDDQSSSAAEKDEKAEKEENATDAVAVWNDTGDCAVPFQPGENYLVYANDDEETNRFSTNVCHRTARISDAGEDLTYLYFNQNEPESSARLEGFVTSEVRHLQQNRFRYDGRIGAPLSDLVVELTGKSGARYTESDEGGRFVFDGLSAGDYQVSIFSERGFPKVRNQLAGPKQVHVAKAACATTTLLVLTAPEHDPKAN